MVRLSYILKKYPITDHDLEYEIHFDEFAIVCIPEYRYNTSATTQIRCYDLGDLENGVHVPMWYRSIIHLLWQYRDRKIRKIVITRDGETIRRYHNIINDLW